MTHSKKDEEQKTEADDNQHDSAKQILETLIDTEKKKYQLPNQSTDQHSSKDAEEVLKNLLSLPSSSEEIQTRNQGKIELGDSSTMTILPTQQMGEKDNSDMTAPTSTSSRSLFWQKCVELAKKQEWGEINVVSSQDSEHDSNEKRYWWIYSQLQLKQLPIAILLAPLQDLLQSYNEVNNGSFSCDDEFEAALYQLTRNMVNEAFHEEVHVVQLYAILKAIRSLCGDRYAFFHEESLLLERLRSRESYELKPVEREILDELASCVEQKAAVSTSEPINREKQETLSLKEQASERSADTESFSANQPDSSQPLQQSRKFFHVSQKSAIVGISMFALLFVLSHYLFRQDVVLHQDRIHYSTTLPQFAPELSLPGHNTVTPRLFRGMLLDVENGESVSNGSQTALLLQQSNEMTTSSKSAAERSSQGKQEQIDMSGPVEPDGLLDDIRRKKEESRNLPGDFVKGVGQDLVERKSSKPKRIESPITYRTIVDTEVRKEPSENAQIVERLTSGAKVRVLRRIGEWLVLVSKNGKAGYIARKDASIDE